ncbi:sugar ABC transporter substrate-binding protein [Blastococcus sp. SYSU D00813]
MPVLEHALDHPRPAAGSPRSGSGRGRRTRLGAVAGIALAVVLSACSSPSEVESDSGSGSSASGSGDGGSVSSDSQELLDVAYEGQLGTPPTTATTPPQDVEVWVVSCGEQVPSCAAPVAGAVDAAETVGWTVNVCDGQLNPNGWGTCVRQAVSAGADVIIPVGIDCPSIQQPFQEARDAGVTVVGGGGADCDSVGGEALWASERLQLEGVSAQDLYELQGKLAADWLIGRTDGQAKVLHLVFTDPLWGPWLAQGFEDEMATCAECEIVSTLEYSNSDVGGGTLPQKFSTALLQAPDANAVFVPVSGVLNAGLGQAVVASGRSADLSVIAALPVTPSYDAIRGDAGLDAVVGYPIEWGGWGSVDTAIRVLNGEEPQVQGDGFQVVDAENNLPEAGQPFTGGVDFEAAYREAWGL